MSTASRRANMARIMAFLNANPCVECGESRPETLQFDHIDPSTKSFAISSALRNNYAWQRIANEMAKCQVLCANCHAIKTAGEQNWYD